MCRNTGAASCSCRLDNPKCHNLEPVAEPHTCQSGVASDLKGCSISNHKENSNCGSGRFGGNAVFWPNVSGRLISGMIWRKTMRHESLNNLRLFLSILWHVFLYLLNQRMAIYHREGQLRIFVPCPLSSRTKISIFMENCSHFDWWNPKMSKTIRGIPNCGAPAGCSSVVIVPWEEKSASGEHQGKKSRFSVQKGQKSSISLQAVGKWRKTFSTCRRKQYLLSFLVPSRCIQL